jgi:hypothetical protein
VVCGGGFLNQVWNAAHRREKLFAILAVMLLAESIGKKTVFLGNTIGPFNESRNFYQMFFSKMKSASIAVRDSILSPFELRSIGIGNEPYNIIDDLYFISKEIDVFSQNVYEKTTQMFGEEDYIIIEQYMSLKDVEKSLEDYRLFSDDMKARHGLNVLFCALDGAYGGLYQGDLIARCAEKIHLWNRADDAFIPINDLVTLVKGAKFVLCQRYHLVVLALANNIPFVQALKDVCGDKRYYYTKSMGTIEKILDGMEFDEDLFFNLNFNEAMRRVASEFCDLRMAQLSLFGEKKRLNENAEYQNRISYIDREIRRTHSE